MSGPHHLLVAGTERHGVTVLARQVAERAGAPTTTSWRDLPAGTPLHVHLTDRLFGATPEEATTALCAVAGRHPVTLTLHDVPQPGDGEWFERRRACYATVLAAADGWATSSATERRTVERHCGPATAGTVVPLPIVGVPAADGADPAGPREHSLAVFGWVYPGKGHVEALRAAARLGATPDERPAVVALGAVAEGHADLVDELAAHAADLGVRLEVTGWLDDADAVRRLRTAGVGLVAHANVSASGSLNSWLAAGRRPLVRSGAYADEMAALRPGTLDLYPADASPADLAARVRPRLAETRAAEVDGAALRPDLDDVAAAYVAWWAS